MFQLRRLDLGLVNRAGYRVRRRHAIHWRARLVIEPRFGRHPALRSAILAGAFSRPFLNRLIIQASTTPSEQTVRSGYGLGYSFR